MVNVRLIMAAFIVATISGCADRPPKSVDLGAVHLSAIDLQNTRMICEDRESRRDNPKACALPTASGIEIDCAINDLIASPDYKPEYDEEGEEINPKPLPQYRVSDLVCTYDSPENVRASCSFGLALPGEAVGARKSKAKLNYRKWYHNTPLTFSHGMRWAVESDCTPDEPQQQ
jgi:hypothetical protein